MKGLAKIIFWAYFILVIISGSLGLSQLENLNIKLLLGLPLLLSLIILNNQKATVINKKLLQIVLVLGGTLIFAFMFSQHYANSRIGLVRWLAALTMLIFGALYSQELKQELPKFLLATGIFFTLYYLLLIIFPATQVILMPATGNNLVFPTYKLHNHLGDFLVLPVLGLIYQLRKPKKVLLFLGWILIFGLLIFYSYSRSSYTALGAGILTLLLIQIKHKPKPYQLILGLLLIFSAGFFLLLTTKETAFNVNFLNAIENKLLLNGRDQYWGVSVQTITDYFWIGIGSKNFIYAMGRYSNIPFNWTESSLNIFLSVFSENGVFAFLAFIALLIWVIKNSRFNLSFVLLIALLVNFQTDYTYEIVGMWLLFWLVLGMSFRNQEPYYQLSSYQMLLPGLIGLILLLQLVITPVLGLFKLYNLIWIIDPLNKTNQEKVIIKQIFSQEYNQALWQLPLYQKLYRADSYSQYAAANYYLVLDKPKEALKAYYQAYQWNPYTNLDLYRRIYALEKKLNGKEAAKGFLRDYQTRLSKLDSNYYFSKEITQDWQKSKRSFELK